MVKPPSCFGPKTMTYVLKGLGVTGAVGCGWYTSFKLMWDNENVRWAIVFFYLSFFCIAIVSAELNLLNHPHFSKFGRFLTTYVGRAVFYIFIGGLLLDGNGWYPGMYMIILGVVNIVSQCLFSDQLDAQVSATTTAVAPTPVAI